MVKPVLRRRGNPQLWSASQGRLQRHPSGAILDGAFSAIVGGSGRVKPAHFLAEPCAASRISHPIGDARPRWPGASFGRFCLNER